MAKTFGDDPRSWSALADFAADRAHADWRNDILSFLLYAPDPEPEHHRVTVDRSLVAQRAPDLGQAPAQGPDRIVSLGEQQRGELAAGCRALTQDEVRQQPPALVAPELVPGRRAPGNGRTAKELDGDAHRLRMVARPGPRGHPRDRQACSLTG